MKKNAIIAMILAALLVAGCSIFRPVRPIEEAINHPLGTDSLKIGMTKEQVKSIVGDPDTIIPLERTKDMLSTAREEWVYNGRYTNVPLKADYFGKSMHLIFDGDNLTDYKSSK